MKTYMVEVSFLDPYPRLNGYRLEGSSFQSVTGKALRQWRKFVAKGRKIKKVTISIQQL